LRINIPLGVIKIFHNFEWSGQRLAAGGATWPTNELTNGLMHNLSELSGSDTTVRR